MWIRPWMPTLGWGSSNLVHLLSQAPPGGGMGDYLIYRANSRIPHHHHQLATMPPHPPSTLDDPVSSDHPGLSPLCLARGQTVWGPLHSSADWHQGPSARPNLTRPMLLVGWRLFGAGEQSPDILGHCLYLRVGIVMSRCPGGGLPAVGGILPIAGSPGLLGRAPPWEI